MTIKSSYPNFNKFAENHSYIARTMALPIALYEGAQWNLKAAWSSLEFVVETIALATFIKAPKRSDQRFSETIAAALLVPTFMALSPLAGAGRASWVFFQIMRNPAMFGRVFE